MIKMKIKDDGSQTIFVNEFSTDKAIFAVEKLIRSGNIKATAFNRAEIDYDCAKGLDWDSNGTPTMFPLKIYGEKISLLVTGVTAGYGGTGPHGTIKIMKMLGFNLTEDDEIKILTKPFDPVTKTEKTKINLCFSK